MGFFKKLFKKKRGGSFVGNLIRGVASNATGGILGSGAGLAKWEAKQDQKEYDAALQKAVNEKLQQNAAFIKGQQTAQNNGLSNIPDRYLDTPQGKKAKNTVVKSWFKDNWWKVVIPAVALLFGVFHFAKKSAQKPKTRRR